MMKACGFFLFALLLVVFSLVGNAFAGPYAPAAGQSGSTAIHMDDHSFVAWATGYLNYSPGTEVDASWQTPERALGKAAGTSFDIVCLGRGGSITMTFAKPIVDGDGADFAIFENSFSDTFIEEAYVEVSADGSSWHRFVNSSLTSSSVNGFGGTIDPTNVYQLGCKYRQGYGEPYDLAQLGLSEISYVRLIDVVGDGTYTDSNGRVIYDPYPTSGSAGFDLDAIGVIHQKVYVGPNASFTLTPASGTVPLTVQFTDTSTGDIDSWSWDFGDGESSSAQNPSHAYQEPGDYTVVLQVSGPAGDDTSTVVKAVQAQGEAPVADFAVSASNGTAPLTVQFADASTGNIVSWVWDFGDGTDNFVGRNPSHTYNDPGTYAVTLSIDGPYGGDQVTKNACVTVDAALVAPSASFTVTPAGGTVPLTVQFTDTSTGDIDSWGWSFGDREYSTEENPSHVYQEPGDYTVTLIVSGPGGRMSQTAQVRVIPAEQSELAAPATPMAAVTFEAGGTLVNPGDTQVAVAAGPIYLQPAIQVDAADQGKQAIMLIYAYLPDSNFGAILGQLEIVLGDKLDFSRLLPQVIDLSGYEGLVFDIIYGYILNDGTIKYNAYEVRVQ